MSFLPAINSGFGFLDPLHVVCGCVGVLVCACASARVCGGVDVWFFGGVRVRVSLCVFVFSFRLSLARTCLHTAQLLCNSYSRPFLHLQFECINF